MGPTFLCELGLFLLCTLLCSGHTRDAVLTVKPSSAIFFIGETVYFKCDMKEGKHTDWEYKLIKDGRDILTTNTNKDLGLKIGSRTQSGKYSCSVHRKSSQNKKNSNTVSVTVLDKPRATLTPGSTIIPVGGSVTLTCSVGSSADWKYEWFRRAQNTDIRISPDDQENSVIRVSRGGIYCCRGRRGNPVYYTDKSDDVTMEITYKPRVTLTPGSTIVPVGGSVTLTCSVGNSTGWKYEWFRRDQNTKVQITTDDQENRVIRVSQGGIYCCRGRRRTRVYYTDKSDDVTMEITFSNKVVVKGRPSRPQIFRGETISLTCEVQEGGETTEWESEWRGPNQTTQWTHNNYWIFNVSESSSGDYKCKSRRRDDSYSSTEWSEAFSLSVSTVPRTESSSFSALLIVGVVCGLLLILLLLLLLCRFKQSKDSSFASRTQSTNQSSATNHIINQDEARDSQHASPHQGDACLYESVREHDDTENVESGDVTYSFIEYKNITQKDDNLLYAEVSHKRTKAKRNKGKSAPAAAEEVVYSEVKSQPALDYSLLYAEVSHNRAKAKRHKGISAPAAADEAVYAEAKSKPALG